MFSKSGAVAKTQTTPQKKEESQVVYINEWQAKFMKRCGEEFDSHFCMYADAQIQSEGGYNPLRWAEYAEGYCSWGFFQNHVCGHMKWSHDTAKYIYYGIQGNYGEVEKERLSKFAYLLDGDWQIEELLRRYKSRIARRAFSDKHCTNRVVLGEELHQDLYCALRLNNWGGGHGYVARVVHKKQELYN